MGGAATQDALKNNFNPFVQVRRNYQFSAPGMRFFYALCQSRDADYHQSGVAQSPE
jgi:hypothetical protein